MRNIAATWLFMFSAGVSAASAQEMTGDAAAGATVFKACAACHFADRPANKIGPYLKGVVGRPVASIEDYDYSEAMKEYGADGKSWDVQILSRYLAAPRGTVPGIKMSFPGLKDEKDIADVIAFLVSTDQE